jgi:hypothetical protein
MEGAPSGSWSTSLGLLAVAARDRSSATSRRGLAWLLDEKGRGPSWFDRLRTRLLGNGSETGMDLQLKGWPWAPGTFSWVERRIETGGSPWGLVVAEPR